MKHLHISKQVSVQRCKAEGHETLNLITCGLCGSATKNQCSPIVHKAAQDAADLAFFAGKPPHIIAAHRKMAAAAAMRRLNRTPQRQPLPYDPAENERWEGVPNPYLTYKRVRDNAPCVVKANHPATRIRRAFHHTLRDNHGISYLGLLTAIAKAEKAVPSEVRQVVGSEKQVMEPCKGCSR